MKIDCDSEVSYEIGSYDVEIAVTCELIASSLRG
jgi:hypothetical protein